MNKVVAFIFLLTFFSCDNNELPKGILPEAKMREVMWDVLRADEWAQYERNIDSAFHVMGRSQERYQQVLQLHNVSEEQFKKSFQYYQSHPTLLKPVLDSLQKRGNVPPPAPEIK